MSWFWMKLKKIHSLVLDDVMALITKFGLKIHHKTPRVNNQNTSCEQTKNENNKKKGKGT
jgi:hypothetical protein